MVLLAKVKKLFMMLRKQCEMILDSFCNRCFLISSDFVYYKIKFAQNNNEAGFLIVCLSVCPIPVNMKCSNTLVQVTTSLM